MKIHTHKQCDQCTEDMLEIGRLLAENDALRTALRELCDTHPHAHQNDNLLERVAYAGGNYNRNAIALLKARRELAAREESDAS